MYVPVHTPTKCLDCHTPITMLVVSIVSLSLYQPSFIGDILTMSTLYPHYIPPIVSALHPNYVCICIYIYIYRYK